MAHALVFAFTAALNPTLLAATMTMLFAAEPRRLLGGYLLGAYTSSIGIGLVIVFALEDSDAVSTTQHTLSPAADAVLGALLLLVAAAIRDGRDVPLRERRQARARANGPGEAPRWQQALDTGSPRAAYAVGILLTLPGASYLVGMTRIGRADASPTATALGVVVFCVIMLSLIEIPLLGYLLRPDTTRRTIERFTAWVGTGARRIVARAAAVIGGLLLLRAGLTLVL